MRNIQNRPLLTGAYRVIGPAEQLPLPIALDPVVYAMGIVAGTDNELYYSDGAEWKIFTDLPPIARPAGLVPTTELEKTQLRLTPFTSFTGLAQGGAVFEVSETGDFENELLFTRTVNGQSVNSYPLEYPEDPLEPGTMFFWRGLYFSEGGSQSVFSQPLRQEYPGIISTPVPETPANEVIGAIRFSPFFSAFEIAYQSTEVEFIDPDTGALIDTVSSTNGAQVTIPGSIADGVEFNYRGRYVGLRGGPPDPVYSDWSIERAGVSGSVATSITYGLTALPSRTVTIGLNAIAPWSSTAPDVFVDWGDGSIQQITTAGTHTHTYAAGPTEAVIQIEGQVRQIGANTASNSAIKRLNSISYRSGIESLAYLLARTVDERLEFVSNLWPETITSLRGFFSLADITELDISDLNTSNITDMYEIFFGSKIGNFINSWDLSQVQTLERSFRSSTFVGDLFWDTSKCENFSNMFYNQVGYTGRGLATFDMRKATNVREMFRGHLDIWREGDVSSWQLDSLLNADYFFLSARPITGATQLELPVATSIKQIFAIYNPIAPMPITPADFSEFSAPFATDWDGFMMSTGPATGLNSLDISGVLKVRESYFRSLEPLPDFKFNKGIDKSWFNTFHPINGLPSPEAYMRTIIGWANTMADESGPTGISWTPPSVGSPYPGGTNYVPSGRFTNGAQARAFLVRPVGVVVEGLGTAGDAVYPFSAGSYTSAAGWTFLQEGGLWALRDASLNLIGKAAQAADTPPEVAIWSELMGGVGVGVFMNGMGWTITGDTAV